MRRKAFEDTGKWMIFKNPEDKKWTVTPPLGTDHMKWERQYHSFAMACIYMQIMDEHIREGNAL